MDLKVTFDQDVNALNILTDETEKEDTCIPLRDEGSVVLGVVHGAMRHIVSIEALGASAWLPLGKRDYDAETDTLTIGLSSGDEVLVTENGDIVGYWVPDEMDPSEFMDPIGVALRNCSASSIFADLASIRFADSPPQSGYAAGQYRYGSWVRRTP